MIVIEVLDIAARLAAIFSNTLVSSTAFRVDANTILRFFKIDSACVGYALLLQTGHKIALNGIAITDRTGME